MSTFLALENLREMPDSVEKVMALKKLAEESISTDHILAKEAVRDAIELAMDLNLDLLLAQSYIIHSNIDFNLRNIDSSFQLTEKALAIYEKIGDEKGIARCFNSIAALTTQLERHEVSIEYLEKALQLNLKNEDWKGCALNKLNIGYLYLSLKEFEKSEKHILESLENYILKIKEAQEQKKLTASAHQFLLELYKTKGDFENLRKWIEETLSYIEGDEGLKQFKAVAMLFYSDLLELEDKLEESIKVMQDSYALAAKSPKLTKEIYSKLASRYKKIGNFEKALFYTEELIKVNDENFAIEKENSYQEMMTKYDVANKEKEAEIHRLKFVEIAEKNKIIEIEKQRSEELLLNIFPAEIAEELKQFNHSEARSYGHVSVMFADMVNFTNVSERLSAIDLVNVLHFYFKNFDIITAKYQIEKIKTIGDCYMCVCGMPTEDEHHAEKIIRAAKEMQQFVESHKNTYDFQFRIGIHSGPLVAGIVGIKKYAYDVWGDTVNTAARLEQNGVAGKINISQTTFELVEGKFDMEYRGKLPVKNKGDIAMYFVN